MTGRSRVRDTLVIVALIPVFLLVASASNGGKAFLTLVVAYGFYVVVSELWGYRKSALFWTAMSVFGLAHIVVLYAMRFPDHFSPAAVVVPPAMADFYVMYIAVKWLMRGTPHIG